MPVSRRDMLRLALSAPVLLARCVESQTAMPPETEEGRLHARPELFETAGPATPKPQRIGLSKTKRDGFFYVPKQDADALLLFLHGAGGSGERAIQRLIEHADRLNAIILAPDSRQETWGFEGPAQAADLAFVDDALEKLFTSHRIDPRRAGIAGFSDGASVALAWGLMNGDLFSGIAAFSPGFVHLTGPRIGTPRIFISHGTNDPILPIDQCGRKIAETLARVGYVVDFREFDGDHEVPPELRTAGLDSLVRR